MYMKVWKGNSLNNNLQNHIFISRKANTCILGLDKLKKCDKKIFLILIDENLGKSAKREASFYSNKYNCCLCQVKDLEKLVKINGCKIISFLNEGLSTIILNDIKGE